MLERPPGGFLTLTEVCTANGFLKMRYHLIVIIKAIAIAIEVIEVIEVFMVSLLLK